MSMLHELLAAEKTVTGAWNHLAEETIKKLKNDHFFQGHAKRLKMLEENEANKAIEESLSEDKAMPTNVLDTLDYALASFAKAEDLQMQKNKTNAKASASIEFRGTTLAEGVPIDELLGLEARLVKIKEIVLAIPTLDAGKNWAWDPNSRSWVAPVETTVKTQKVTIPIVLAAATDKHPAQVKEGSEDKTVGKFTVTRRSGAATAAQKADMILIVDELLAEVKKARQRANSTPVVDAKIGSHIVNLILSPLKTGG